MKDDPIVAEVRAIRESHAAKFGYDLDAIYRDVKQREKASGRSFVTFRPRRRKPTRDVAAPDQCSAAAAS